MLFGLILGKKPSIAGAFAEPCYIFGLACEPYRVHPACHQRVCSCTSGYIAGLKRYSTVPQIKFIVARIVKLFKR